MMHDHFPGKRRGRERLVGICGVSGEIERLADLPLGTRSRSINKSRGRGVSGRDQYPDYVKCSLIVRHFELHVVEFRLRVVEGGLSRQGITEVSVTVQVP